MVQYPGDLDNESDLFPPRNSPPTHKRVPRSTWMDGGDPSKVPSGPDHPGCVSLSLSLVSFFGRGGPSTRVPPETVSSVVVADPLDMGVVTVGSPDCRRKTVGFTKRHESSA